MRFDDRLTERAKTAVNYAYSAAAELGHGYVGSEHLLIGLAREGGGAAARCLRANGFDADTITRFVEETVGKGAAVQRPAQGFTPRAKQIIELAIAQAARSGRCYIGTEHLLIGILHESGCSAVQLLLSRGADINKMYTELADQLSGTEQPPSSSSSGARFQSTAQPQGRQKCTARELERYSRDLSAAAEEGALDPVIGRESEIRRVIQILSRRTKNNPVLIGEPGVGKTAIAEGLAQKISDGDVPQELCAMRIVSLDLSSMVAGTKYRGDFEDRIKNVLDEVKGSGNIILFIDELHTMIGAGAAEGAIDAANIIKPALSRGEIQIVGATTLDEYRRHIEKDAALERRFQPVTVREPSADEAYIILTGLREKYERHHKLKITDEAIRAAVDMSVRYVNGRYLPDKAIDLIDEAASRVRLSELDLPPSLKSTEAEAERLRREKEAAAEQQDYEQAALLRDTENACRAQLDAVRAEWERRKSGGASVTREDIAAVVSGWTGIPVHSITDDESRRLLEMENILHRRVIGQDDAVAAVSRAIRRGRVGLKDPRRPIGSFLLLGPTGVGKTELCRALAEAMFGDENAMIKLDMSEYMERHSVSRLIGSPPGYVGHDEGGQLTERVRRKPYCVVLFDEIEKAHEDVHNLLLQILEDGVLTDSCGHRVDFRNAVVVITSNVGSQNITEKKKSLGFAPAGDYRAASEKEINGSVMSDLRKAFKPELLNRIDETVVFRSLTRGELKSIAALMVGEVSARLDTLGIKLETQDDALELLADIGFDPAYGARPLRRAVRACVEDRAAEMLLDGTLGHGDMAVACVEDGKIILRVAKQCA